MSNIQTELNAMLSATAQNKYKEQQANGPTQELDGDAFLYLMMEQLKNQDPTNPMDNSEMLSQQAQFTQVQELQNLSEAMSQNNMIVQATSLVGKNVTVIDPNDTTKTITGMVESANFTNSAATVVIDGVDYPLGLVASVGTEASTQVGTPTSAEEIGKTKLRDLNMLSGITEGAITLRVQDGSNNNFITNHVIDISRDMTVNDLVKKFNVAGVSAEIQDGKIVLTPKGDNYAIAINDGNINNTNAQSSNFVTKAGFGLHDADEGSYASKVLDVQKATE